MIQKLKVESEVRALKFDDTGLFCFAGTKAGAVHVLEASDTINIRFKFKTSLGRVRKNTSSFFLSLFLSSATEGGRRQGE